MASSVHMSKFLASLVVAILASLVHKHETITKPAISTTETSTSTTVTLTLLNTLLTEYSSLNFIMRAVNSNTMVISNYGENATLGIPISRIVADDPVAFQIPIDIGTGNNTEVHRDLGAPPGGDP